MQFKLMTLLAALVLMVGTAAFAQNQPEAASNGMPLCSANYDGHLTDAVLPVNGLQDCAGTQPGRMGFVADGLTADDCTAGGGTSKHVCISQGDGTFSAMTLGAVPTITAVTTKATVAPTAAQLSRGCKNVVYTNDGDTDGADIALPDITASNIGMCVTLTVAETQVLCAGAAADDNVLLGAEAGGVLIGVGESIDSGNTVGDSTTLLAHKLNEWVTLSMVGVWVDGGAACP